MFVCLLILLGTTSCFLSLMRCFHFHLKPCGKPWRAKKRQTYLHLSQDWQLLHWVCRFNSCNPKNKPRSGWFLPALYGIGGQSWSLGRIGVCLFSDAFRHAIGSFFGGVLWNRGGDLGDPLATAKKTLQNTPWVIQKASKTTGFSHLFACEHPNGIPGDQP